MVSFLGLLTNAYDSIEQQKRIDGVCKGKVI